MQKMKRTLSLTLSGLMLTSALTIGVGAKGLDNFADENTIINRDAVAVTSQIGIFKGYEDGSFGPERTVTRAEMAVIIAKMLYGADVKVDQFTEADVFTDVPEWAAGYINLCASLGIVAGVGDNQYDPGSTVTTAQAALMLSKALGYFKNESDYGTNWMLAATAKGTELGLYDNLDLSATAGLSRDDVAEMTFNALTKAVPVEYSETFNIYYNVQNGLIYGLQFNYLETLGYENFDLVYTSKENADDFGRPGTVWGIGTVGSDATDANGDLTSGAARIRTEIITQVDDADYIFTGKTEQKDVYKAVGSSLANGIWDYYVNGKESGAIEVTVDGDKTTVSGVEAPAKNSDKPFTDNGNGYTTELYVVDEEVIVVQYGHYLVQVDRVRSDDDGAYVTVSTPRGVTLNDKDFHTEDFKEDDAVLITIGYNSTDDKHFIASMTAPETVSGALTAQSTSHIRMDGTKYDFSTLMNNDLFIDMNDKALTLKNDYKLYLDPNGYVVAIDEVDASEMQYLYVESIGTYLSKTEAEVVFADGTKETIVIDTSDDAPVLPDTDGKLDSGYVASYTISGGKYELVALDNNDITANIENDARTVASFRVKNDTMFVDIENGKVYAGYENVPDYTNATFSVGGEEVAGSITWADVIFITDGEPSTKTTTFFMLKDTKFERRAIDGTTYHVFTNAYVNGEKVTENDGLWIREKLADTLSAYTLYEVKSTDTNENISALTDFDMTSITPLAIDEVTSSTLWEKDSNNSYTFDKDTIFVLVNETEGSKKIDTANHRDIVLEKDAAAGETYTQIIPVKTDKDDDNHLEVVYLLVTAKSAS